MSIFLIHIFSFFLAHGNIKMFSYFCYPKNNKIDFYNIIYKKFFKIK